MLPLAAEIVPALTQAAMMSAALAPRCTRSADRFIISLKRWFITARCPSARKHAQAMRHVVQRGVELACQRRLALARDQRPHENPLQAGRDVLERQEEQHVQDGQPDVIWVAMQRQRHRQRAAGKQHLHMENPRPAIGPAAACRHVAIVTDMQIIWATASSLLKSATMHQSPSAAA